MWSILFSPTENILCSGPMFIAYRPTIEVRLKAIILWTFFVFSLILLLIGCDYQFDGICIKTVYHTNGTRPLLCETIYQYNETPKWENVETRRHNHSGDICKYRRTFERKRDDELTAQSPNMCMLGHITRLDNWQNQHQRKIVTSNRVMKICIVMFPLCLFSTNQY